MTGGFLNISIMKLNPCRVVLYMVVLTGLLLTLNADGEDLKCETDIKIRRNTIYESFVGGDLRINCTVAFCRRSPPIVSWLKIEKISVPVNVSSGSHIKTNWTTLTDSEGISSLIFTNILSNDSGEYQCSIGSSVSHTINVSVCDNRRMTPTTWSNGTTVTASVLEPTERLWLYVYSSAGIVAFVIMVIIISVISMRGCKGKSKQKTPSNHQYMEIPMVEQLSSQASPRGSPSAPALRRSTGKARDGEPDELTLPSHDQLVYSKVRRDRQRQRDVAEEEEGSVVYAALNHHLPPTTAGWPLRPQQECSEYAAIRVS